ncbi:SGNH/GDSL hydrolase family protein [Nocardioides solisilvae]|uniref:SGNH/GDSL hydrolase family protein n=1 Tax=Nocardioides solisilvae TaxID=1542435 RepID=UPI000D74F7AB|nr:SGNH/GDSL hydrolase family protein [Nocardioides solisilvae]
MRSGTAPRVLLLGDSHLARLGPRVPALGAGVVNRARGGASSRDLAGQVAAARADAVGGRYDAAVVSVGTNDAAPWKQVPLEECASLLAAAVADLPCPVVLLAPPGVDEARLTRERDRTEAVVAHYRARLSRVVLASDGRVVAPPGLLAPLGPDAFLADGVHLTPAAYDVLLPAVAAAVSALLGPVPVSPSGVAGPS